MTPIEQIALLRWKLAANPLLAPGRRAAVAKMLERLGSTYPGIEAVAARAAADGDWATAARFYEVAAAQAPDDVRLRANAALARARGER